MKIGIYGGTWDTIHEGHLAIIDDMVAKVDVLYLIPTSVSYYKEKRILHTYEERYNRILSKVNSIIPNNKDYEKIIVSDIEKDKNIDWRYVDTLKVICKRYPNQEIYTALGADSFINLPKWESYKSIIANTKFIVYNRPGYDIANYPNIEHEFVNINIDCSSTKDRESMRGMTDEEFLDLLDESFWKTYEGEL